VATIKGRRDPTMELTQEEIELIQKRLEALKIEHRDLDDVIKRLSYDQKLDELQMQRLKKRKLLLKDQISTLERQLVPDISA
jgi:hypothetical protein